MSALYKSMHPTQFPNTSAASLLLPLFSILNNQKYSPDTTCNIQGRYDYIVIGAGPAGATLAARLSEKPCVTVILLEAGGSPPLLSEIPAKHSSFIGTNLDWNYFTVPQKHVGSGLYNNQFPYALGKAIGGSSITNKMLYARGAHQIYDQWAAYGATGWSYEDVLPYFKKSEMNLNPESIEKDYHGFQGPMTVETPIFENRYKSALRDASFELGYGVVDVNGAKAKGFYNYQLNTRKGQRCSSAKAYLVPAEKRKNLAIVKNAMVTKVIIENKRAIGIHVDHLGKSYEIRACREVILSAGAINTPQLLMLSGIGPKEHLKEMNIPLIVDLPVGLNLQNQVQSFLNYYTDRMPDNNEKVDSPTTIWTYLLYRTGLLASSLNFYIAFGPISQNRVSEDVPDYELYFSSGSGKDLSSHHNLKKEIVDKVFRPYENKSQLSCSSAILQPKSRGTVRLQSANVYDSPLIDPNYYEDPADLKVVVEGLKECDRAINTNALKAIGVKPFKTLINGCESYYADYDAYLTCVAKIMVKTSHHSVGTAKMGRLDDPTTVVDPELRVKGICGLRVVDASVMPIIPAGNTNNPTVMIAEKAADIIKKNIRCVFKFRGCV